jgi:hypothetical protein
VRRCELDFEKRLVPGKLFDVVNSLESKEAENVKMDDGSIGLVNVN